ncbi:MAG TPA: YbhB/YbcL family Raf kinase inhibitor-like protein [Bryobacteraceae bacterium]|nr:YbhB/YbcL family Raf kinase inhibitor-like protein [Bryobacteraceae bacterium]
MGFKIFSSAFSEGGWIPSLHSCHGADLSPSLEWSGDPADTLSFALVVEDPDAPAGVWCHWLLYDISAKVHNLAQGYKPGALGVSGQNDFGKLGYNGPCPPRGGPHRYDFKLYALNVHTLGLPPGAKRAEVLPALKGHILGEAQYVGRFQSK